jgi:hypothetical protein
MMDEQADPAGPAGDGAVPGETTGTEARSTQALAEHAFTPPPPPPAPPTTSTPERHHSSGWRGGWLVAVVLIIVGVVLLVQNVSGKADFLHNWWALFILIPAVGSFANAWRDYVDAGRRFGPGVVRPLTIGLVLVAVTVIFLLDAWDEAWPALLIIIGLGMVFSWRRRR